MKRTSILRNASEFTAGIFITILTFALIMSPILAEGGIIDVSQDVYDQILEHFDYQEFTEVEALCEQLGTYLDSRLYLVYARARNFINKAEYNEASALFSALSIMEFHDSSAWDAYAMGMVNYKKRDYAAAIPYFEDAQSISDTIDKLIECRNYVKNMFLSNARCIDAGAENLLIEWTDTEKGHYYIVRYAPRYVEKGFCEVMASERQVELNNLIPGTEYIILITIEGMPGQSIEFIAQTKQPEGGKSMFSLHSINLYNYNRNDEKKYGLDRLIENSKVFMTEITNSMISLPDAPPASSINGYVMVALLSVNSKDASEIIDARLVLRLNKYGTYDMRTGTSFLLKETRYPSVKFQLNDIFDTIYTQQDTWPQATGSYELYISNIYIGGGDLTLSTQN